MENVLVVLGILCIALIFLKLNGLIDSGVKSRLKEKDNLAIKHIKKEYLATQNEQKLYFALQKALSKNYHVHCQTSLIAIVEPTEFKHKKRAYSKRMDFVITDTATKIVAVIELDDSTHKQPKRIARDKYVNAALKPHHPLIRIPTTPFYKPEDIAGILEVRAGITNIFRQAQSDFESLVQQEGGV